MEMNLVLMVITEVFLTQPLQGSAGIASHMFGNPSQLPSSCNLRVYDSFISGFSEVSTSFCEDLLADKNDRLIIGSAGRQLLPYLPD